MSNQAMKRTAGFICPVRGCDKRQNRLFGTIGLTLHMRKKHPGQLEKRLKLKYVKNKKAVVCSRINIILSRRLSGTLNTA